ncbi:MAG: glycosyltransferase [Polaromonas sp.]|nr:glycosyltransferase [Polaromonas sp.]
MEFIKSWPQRWVYLVEKLENIKTPEERINLIKILGRQQKPLILAFANAHALNLAAESLDFFESLYQADIVLRDGSGMETLFNHLNISPGLNLNGTDMIPEIIREFNGRDIAVFGTQEPFLGSGKKFIGQSLAPQSKVVTAHGFLDVPAYLELANKHSPAIIVLGMGMPKQEQVALALRSSLQHPCLIVCGGAIIDFWGGKISRAPAWMRRTGMEWVFRLYSEPQRLFKRYVNGNLLFLSRTLALSTFYRRSLKNIKISKNFGLH